MNSYFPLPYVLAGGPGSGCHGEKCGRPRGAQQFKTSSGASYTIYAPSRKGIPKSQHTVKEKADKLKGQYRVANIEISKGQYQDLQDIRGHVKGTGEFQKRLSSVYDAKYGKDDVYEGHGTTIFVHRDFGKGRVVVHVIPHDEFNKSATAESYKFKNFGKAAGFLNKKFGIKQKLPKPGALAGAAEEKTDRWKYDLVKNFDPEEIENILDKVFSEHGQAFKFISIDEKGAWVELENGKRVRVQP